MTDRGAFIQINDNLVVSLASIVRVRWATRDAQARGYPVAKVRELKIYFADSGITTLPDDEGSRKIWDWFLRVAMQAASVNLDLMDECYTGKDIPWAKIVAEVAKRDRAFGRSLDEAYEASAARVLTFTRDELAALTYDAERAPGQRLMIEAARDGSWKVKPCE